MAHYNLARKDHTPAVVMEPGKLRDQNRAKAMAIFQSITVTLLSISPTSAKPPRPSVLQEASI